MITDCYNFSEKNFSYEMVVTFWNIKSAIAFKQLFWTQKTGIYYTKFSEFRYLLNFCIDLIFNAALTAIFEFISIFLLYRNYDVNFFVAIIYPWPRTDSLLTLSGAACNNTWGWQQKNICFLHFYYFSWNVKNRILILMKNIKI